MRWQETAIPGAMVFTPAVHEDDRGIFLESYTARALHEATGVGLHIAQINISVSRKGVVRGLHACRIPPGQAKYVQCVAGDVMDVVLDIDPASPTFKQHISVALNDRNRQAVFIAEGLAHGFCVLSDTATLMYATSSPYSPQDEFTIDPLDPELGISWPSDNKLILSERDAQAPTLREVLSIN